MSTNKHCHFFYATTPRTTKKQVGKPLNSSLVHDLDQVLHDAEAQKAGSSGYIRPIPRAGDLRELNDRIPCLTGLNIEPNLLLPQFPAQRSKVSAPTICQESRCYAADGFDSSVALFEGLNMALLIIDEMEDDEESEKIY
jgi:hypothetical protein